MFRKFLRKTGLFDDIFLLLRYTSNTNKTCVMKLTLLITGLIIFSALFLSFTRPTTGLPGRPGTGTTRVVIQDIEYYSGIIEGSNCPATWPVAKFSIDPNAVQYRVKLLKSGASYTWEKNEKTQSAYAVFPQSNNIKENQYYIGLGRTWGGTSPVASTEWEKNSRAVFGVDNKVEITFYYYED